MKSPNANLQEWSEGTNRRSSIKTGQTDNSGELGVSSG